MVKATCFYRDKTKKLKQTAHRTKYSIIHCITDNYKSAVFQIDRTKTTLHHTPLTHPILVRY